MELKTSIKQHDFISGKPMNEYDRLLINWSNVMTTNPCHEISLDGYGQGELGVVMAPQQLGRRSAVVNMDYTSLYPEIQRTHDIIPNDNERLVDHMVKFLEERQERRGTQQEIRERFINKMMRNSIY